MKKGLHPLFSAQYDLADRVTYTDNAGSVDMPQVQLRSHYDYEGNRFMLSDSQGGSVWYAWNNQRLQSMVMYTENNKSAQVGFGYDSVGRLASLMRTECSCLPTDGIEHLPLVVPTLGKILLHLGQVGD